MPLLWAHGKLFGQVEKRDTSCPSARDLRGQSLEREMRRKYKGKERQRDLTWTQPNVDDKQGTAAYFCVYLFSISLFRALYMEKEVRSCGNVMLLSKWTVDVNLGRRMGYKSPLWSSLAFKGEGFSISIQCFPIFVTSQIRREYQIKSVICSADQQGLFRVSPYCKNMIPLPDMAPNRAAHLGYQLASSPLKLLPASPSCSVSCNVFGSIAHNRGQSRAQWLMATIHIKASKALPCQQHTALNQTKLTLGLVYTVALFLSTYNVTQIFFKSTWV